MSPLSMNHWRAIGAGLISCFAYTWIAYFLDRSHFFELLFCFSIAFGLYFFLLNKADRENLQFYLGIGVVFRLLFLLSVPTLSDDYFRFIWDGQLLTNGLNPFDSLPTAVNIDFPNKDVLLNGMNSQAYYTVYPPLAQWIYYLATEFSPNSILGSIVIMRSILLMAEIGVILLLPKLLQLLHINPAHCLWYVLNPLVIVELTGNLHFEGIVIFFFLLALYLLIQKRSMLASFPWALAAATKLIPLFLLPVMLRRLPFKRTLLFYLLVGGFFIALWVPFYNSSFLSHFQESINLYYATFEFNASVYYIIRWIGFQLVDYNIIAIAGSWLSKIAFIGMILLLIRKQNIKWEAAFKSMLFALSLYYFFALIVHPWYLTYLVFLSVFIPFRYAIIWSAMAVLSYWAYNNPNYLENYWLIMLEYVIVILFFLREVFGKRNSFLFLEKT